jgi:hypothetical protein
MWFDERARAWSTAGCRVLNVSETAIACACTHLTDFAVRFAALDQADADLFALDAPIPDVRRAAMGVLLLGAVGITALLTAVFAAGGAALDGAARARFGAALASDGDLALAAALDAAAEAREPPPLVVSAAAAGSGGARSSVNPSGARTAKVAPGESVARRSASKRARSRRAARVAPADAATDENNDAHGGADALAIAALKLGASPGEGEGDREGGARDVVRAAVAAAARAREAVVEDPRDVREAPRASALDAL